jgi:CBS domain containing-hemolysin-like protein
MTAAAAVSWVVVFVGAAAYLAVAATISTFGDRVAAFRFSRRAAEPDEERPTEPLYLAGHTLILGRGIQAAALLSAALALLTALDNTLPASSSDIGKLAISASATFAGAMALQVTAWALTGGSETGARRLLGPVATALNYVSGFSWPSWLGRISRLSPDGATPAASPGQAVSEALKENLDLLEEAGIPIEQRELRMIRGILRMDTVKVREVMRPRVDMVSAGADMVVDDLTALVTETSHSKLPVYERTVDNIIGIAHARDLLSAHRDGRGKTMTAREIVRPALFVPESQSLERLLREFQEKRTGMAIVVDEHGGVSGLITRTDLIEEIVGTLGDDSGEEHPEMMTMSEGEMLLDGRISIADLNRLLGTAVQASGFDTLGGLVYRELGKVPSPGDTLTVDGLAITVQTTTGRRVRQVRVRRKADDETGSAV